MGGAVSLCVCVFLSLPLSPSLSVSLSVCDCVCGCLPTDFSLSLVYRPLSFGVNGDGTFACP